jgi:hypothetical protein
MLAHSSKLEGGSRGALGEEMADWSLTSLHWKLIKIGAHTITFQLAKVAVSGPMVRAIFAAIHRLRAPPSYA